MILIDIFLPKNEKNLLNEKQRIIFRNSMYRLLFILDEFLFSFVR